jgi:hypothetical protein
MSQAYQGTAPTDVVHLSQRLAETTQPINQAELEIFFNAACRYPGFFQEAARVVQEYHFDPAAEMQYALLWRALVAVAKDYGAPNTETLTVAVYNYLQQQGGMLPEDLVQSILRQDGQGLIWSSMNTEADATTLAFARAILQRFLHERTIVIPLRRQLSQGVGGSYPANMGDFLQAIVKQQDTIRSVREVPRAIVAPAIGTPITRTPDVFKLIGIPWIDRLLHGHRVGDANGIIGVIGGGKTTMAVHMAAASAKQCWTDAQQSGKRPEFVIFVTAEEPESKVLPRIQSAAFQIPRVKLAGLSDWSQLTTQATLDHYEQQLSIDIGGGQDILSETDRWHLNHQWVNECFELLDFSGSDRYPHAGEGFIPEMVANIDALIQMRNGQQPRAVFIDWAGILCERHMDSIGVTRDQIRHYLGPFGGMVRRQISERFQTTSWIAHQIKGSELTSSPTKLLHHSMAAESTAFATELAVCGCIGVPDADSGCRRLNFSKIRYRDQVEVEPVTVRIHPLFNMLEDVSTRYGVSDDGRSFALLADLLQTQGMSAAGTRNQPQAGPQGLRADDPGTAPPPRRRTDPDITALMAEAQ